MSAEEPRQFVDTNVLVYAHDRSAGVKQERALDLLRELWRSRLGCMSIQVLQEFYVNITRKVPHTLRSEEAQRVVAALSSWHVHRPSAEEVLDAIVMERRYQISFWDAMILRSASALGCPIVWSEDLNAGQQYGKVEVRNPFLAG